MMKLGRKIRNVSHRFHSNLFYFPSLVCPAQVIALIEEVCDQEAQLTDELSAILSDLTTLNKTENAKVALKARQVLIASITPSYELRHNQVRALIPVTVLVK